MKWVLPEDQQASLDAWVAGSKANILERIARASGVAKDTAGLVFQGVTGNPVAEGLAQAIVFGAILSTIMQLYEMINPTMAVSNFLTYLANLQTYISNGLDFSGFVDVSMTLIDSLLAGFWSAIVSSLPTTPPGGIDYYNWGFFKSEIYLSHSTCQTISTISIVGGGLTDIVTYVAGVFDLPIGDPYLNAIIFAVATTALVFGALIANYDNGNGVVIKTYNGFFSIPIIRSQ